MLKKTTRVAAKAAGGAMAVGRFASAVFGLALVVGLTAGAASVALGANGGNFILGKSNVATALTKLAGNVNGPAMQVQNTNPGTDDTALSLAVGQGEAPMRVNSAARVANLNADKLDGKDSGDFVGGTYGVQASATGPGGGSRADRSVSCDEGDVAVGGGGFGTVNDDDLLGSLPSGRNWFVRMQDNGVPSTLIVAAVCADFPPLRP